ncbi:hypothetical protein AUEXF2481DRAFT_570622 [Aureobasidium subglaciale EXF-2481]|uniref:Uncharacterized protein n=1 Tax=Aureobasidium subglaciale (strain EXF-2481) TaxID=1043005 RepID=A0A074Y8B6_AURSE|nr:uncharacterized protein AUEXF2481DRAFT_570622 [Aureobasidium subglaciale EXF-2481]KEQ90457.1 hypothetical protein AUEXF2481DRAFT_570622 [Aureobasidium subglaciale EXF-2481]
MVMGDIARDCGLYRRSRVLASERLGSEYRRMPRKLLIDVGGVMCLLAARHGVYAFNTLCRWHPTDRLMRSKSCVTVSCRWVLVEKVTDPSNSRFTAAACQRTCLGCLVSTATRCLPRSCQQAAPLSTIESCHKALHWLCSQYDAGRIVAGLQREGAEPSRCWTRKPRLN